MKLDKDFFGFYVFAFVLPLPLPLIVSSLAMAVLIINCLMLIKKPIRVDGLTIAFLLFFLSDLIALVLSGRSFAENTIINEVKITCAILPLLVYNIGVKEKLKTAQNSILTVFSLGVLAYIVFCILFYGYFIYTHPRYTVQIDRYLFWAIENNFPGTYHRTYIGAYIVLSSVFVANLIFNLPNLKKRLILSFVFILQLTAIFFLGSKLTMVLFLVLNTLLLLVKYKPLVIPFFVSIAVCFFLIKEWILVSMKKSFYDRTVFFKKSVELIGENFLFGVGEKNITGFMVSINGEITALIPHNVFLKETLSNGLIGLVILLFLFGYILYYATKSNDRIFKYFLILVLTICFIEDFIYLQRGLFLFVFLSVFFVNVNRSRSS
ncbi:O-antigen ligase [Zobellia sp. 1_MG-2023]|uniref:O-antigen ligase family protein n=1 Tax=Zobellia sp. 1_MG-2023 TaxID=3062626 RepID=UPI0026E3CC15|nr:hypothetical protein [Zobellia sp. 1_MG-2023]MDO6818172.1 hypothetical protein [Zobellia sp. 1_MG-2023]